MTDLTILAEGLQFPEGPVACPDGSVLLVEIQRKTVTRVSADGAVSIVAQLDGGPNGAALGPDGALYICNNGGFLFRETGGINRTTPGVPEGYAGGWIERLDLATGARRILYTQCGDHRLVGPNDIVFDRQGGFYFTDYGKMYPRHRMNGGLYYAQADGSRIVEVAYPMVLPNGVGLAPDESAVYVAETDSGRIWAFDLTEPGVAPRRSDDSPHGGRLICGLPGYQRLDSLALDVDGNIHVATLNAACVSVISPDGAVLEQIPTGDPITTNVCFGGPDRRTAYVTLSGWGRLVSFPSRYEGLKLNWAA